MYSVETFDKADAVAINKARLEHLDSLGLDLSGKSVLDVGAGVGHLAQYFIKKDCDVLCIEGRIENVNRLSQLYPATRCVLVDIEKCKLSTLGTFDIVFCYGLLYHLENPAHALKNMATVCREMILIETCITDSVLPLNQWVEETPDNSQALNGIGSRPSPSYIIKALELAGFPFVRSPETLPDYPDYHFKRKTTLTTKRKSITYARYLSLRRTVGNGNA